MTIVGRKEIEQTKESVSAALYDMNQSDSKTYCLGYIEGLIEEPELTPYMKVAKIQAVLQALDERNKEVVV